MLLPSKDMYNKPTIHANLNLKTSKPSEQNQVWGNANTLLSTK